MPRRSVYNCFISSISYLSYDFNYQREKGKGVKSPKGFGKRYFALASILAHSVQNRLQSLNVKTDHLLKCSASKEKDEIDENDPPIECLTSLITLNAKPCHCNCFFRLRTRIILKTNHYIPRCPYYTTWFAFRRTGVHPPYITL